jgi:glycine/D-amino acid oxidase-like deaminating enzyme
MAESVGWDVDDRVASWPGLPALDRDVTADACVVGLGGSGLAAVDELLGRGLSVVGLDAGRVAAAAAGRNGGFLVAGPWESLYEASAAWGEDVAVDLFRATLQELDRLADVLGPGVVRRSGSLRLAGLPGPVESEAESADRAAELALCRSEADLLRRRGFPAETYDGPLGQGLFQPRDGAVNPAVRAVTLAGSLAGRAALYENSPVLGVSSGRVDTARGTVRAAVVVIAVDGRLDVLVPQLAGLTRTARLQMVSTAPADPGRLPCPVYGRYGYDYAQQGPDGRLFVGGGRDRFAEQEWTTESGPTDPVQAYLDRLAVRFAGAPVTVEHRWAAPVGFTTDGRALCFPVDDGVVAVGGYSGTGNLVGPVAARAAVALVTDGTPPPAYFRSAF